VFEDLNLILQVVKQLDKVKLMEGFFGIWSPFLPQYFTKAILLGDFQLDSPFKFLGSILLKINVSDIKLLT
jgi:hypothetical protein